MTEYGFPTEQIDLPSAGKLYPSTSPLSTGKLDIKYMTAKEEDILTSTNLIQKGTVIDKLIESLVVTKGVSPDDLVIGDTNAVLIASRILAYGKDYPIEVSCQSCEGKFKHTVDLSLLEMTTPDATTVEGEFSMELPTGLTITFKLLTRRDEKAIKQEVDAMKKFNNNIETDSSTRLKYIIKSVNGERDRKKVRDFVDGMIMRDIRALREEIKRVSPDVKFDLDISCELCGHLNQVRMPMGANFFWPDIDG